MADTIFNFWFSMGRCVAFSGNDVHLFRVWPKHEQYDKNRSVDLMPKFMKATNLNAARAQAHRFVDSMFDGYAKADGNSSVYPAPKFVEPEIPLDQIVSLTIESLSPADGQPDIEMKSLNNDLLNLKDLA